MSDARSILMVAAENGVLDGGKVGGIGDVIREAPPALARLGAQVQVVTPAFGRPLGSSLARSRQPLNVGFRGGTETLGLVQLNVPGANQSVRHYLFEHPAFTTTGSIYSDDPPDAPFASDASKFALFCAAVAQAIVDGHFGHLDVLHLHDWHAAWLLVLRRYAPELQALQSLRTVYTIHNLALQGVRPFAGHTSSFSEWFPKLVIEPRVLRDPRWPDCINPMASAIRLADAVHAVSPSYAQEITRPSAVEERGYYGGEGLEADLLQADREGRLHGILNGCEYSAATTADDLDRRQLLQLAETEQLRWMAAGSTIRSTHFLAQTRLRQWSQKALPTTLITGVGRVTGQKVGLLQYRFEDGQSTLDRLLRILGEDSLFVFLGSGGADAERFLAQASATHANFIFLNGYSERLAAAIYQQGDLFLMPSSFEPCGISQMLAMRVGQPCLVHGVGGLRDTVRDGVDGFVFNGASPQEQALNLLAKFEQAIDLRMAEPEVWQQRVKAARLARFDWNDSASRYLQKLYR